MTRVPIKPLSSSAGTVFFPVTASVPYWMVSVVIYIFVKRWPVLNIYKSGITCVDLVMVMVFYLGSMSMHMHRLMTFRNSDSCVPRGYAHIGDVLWPLISC